MEEVHSKATLNARIENDTKELYKFSEKSEDQKEKVQLGNDPFNL